MIQIQNIAKYFGGVRAVKDCSFKLESQKITALIGPNGAGKTTLFNIINGFIIADKGSVYFKGENITKFPAWKRSRIGISRTFQHSRIFKNLSIKDNLKLAARSDDYLFWRNLIRNPKNISYDAKIYEVIEFIGLKKDLNVLLTEVSYGEQKLFDLARALINPHSILLLDEPVAGVNPVLREKLKGLMFKLKQKGETVLLIEHDIDFVRSVADLVIVLDQGKVLKEGEPEEVLKDKEVLEAYLGSG